MDEPCVVHGVSVRIATEVNDPAYDALVVVTGAGGPLPQALEDFILAAQEFDAGLNKSAGVVRCARVCGERLVLAPAGGGRLTPYHDVRSVGEACGAGVARAVQAGARRVCVALPTAPRWGRAPLVALLHALEALYTPLQIRESFPEKTADGVTSLGVYCEGVPHDARKLLRDAAALEIARLQDYDRNNNFIGNIEGEILQNDLAYTVEWPSDSLYSSVTSKSEKGVARDVGGADPERMTALASASLVRALFANERDVSVRVVEDRADIERRYPLFAAVDRAASVVPRHRGCIVFVEYSPATYDETLMFVGKGVTYDTGGCDVKTGGAMAGMSRDKCGAAAVLGFVQACVSLRAPLKVVAALAMVRNSIGAEAYVADELLRTRAGRALRVVNTDAEGRLAVADLLHEMAERAAKEKRPHVYTVATLTGHAHRAYGPYTACLDNHVARERGHAGKLAAAGEEVGEGAEVSTVRREDLEAHAGRGPHEDLHQAETSPSTAVPRGHQGPAGFLLLASGLDAGSVPHTHLDVAGSAGAPPAPPTAAPLLALAALHHLITYDK